MIKKILPDLIAVLAFVLISFAYFFPADMEGRILFQHDTAAGAAPDKKPKSITNRQANAPAGPIPFSAECRLTR